MATKLKNVLLVTVDAFRADHLGCYGYRRNTSPSIDNLAKDGVLFSQAISHGGSTPQVFMPILASNHPPFSHPSVDPQRYRKFVSSQALLSEILKGYGYTTAAFHTNPYLARFYGYHRGFDVFYDGIKGGTGYWAANFKPRALTFLSKMKLGIVQKLYYWLESLKPPYARAGELTKKALSWMKKNHCRSFFLWIHYMDTHLPLVPPKEYLYKFKSQARTVSTPRLRYTMRHEPFDLSERELKTLADSYDAAIAYVDNNIALIINALKRHSLLDKTLIIVTADHGEELGERGQVGHENARLHENLIHVPLVIHGLDKEGKLVGEQVSHWDLPPTIIAALGLPPRKSFRGRNLLPLIRGEQLPDSGVFGLGYDIRRRQRALFFRTQNWKYIFTSRYDKEEIVSEELYNLEHDPDETRNLYLEEKDIVDTLRARLMKAFFTTCQEQGYDFARSQAVPEEAKEAERVKNRIRELRRQEKI